MLDQRRCINVLQMFCAYWVLIFRKKIILCISDYMGNKDDT